MSLFKIPDELTRWLIEQGADIEATDNYKRTALHEQAGTLYGNIELLLALGANIEAQDYQDATPLHKAASAYRVNHVQTLIAHGANIYAEDQMGRTPLAAALDRCQNANINRMADIAELLLEAGNKIPPKMRERVTSIGEMFEFHRANFSKDNIAKTEAGLSKLYRLFDVTPVAKRQMYDGVSDIVVSSSCWQQAHQELWERLVPSSGSADTVQGEVIRVTGRLSHEILDNGGANWDADFRKMLSALLVYFKLGNALEAEKWEEAKTIAAPIKDGSGDTEALYRLTEFAVDWVRLNPVPVAVGKVEYRR
ncbi:ankyrin repeat domain-containing protein [Limnobaculum parvum]|uniref:ankyrin repeat domain-containing protein n=1 Tax=Limnobaculum parvum TaxID=2172103 RepID=UPI001E5C1C71|nr:ankyrin repeat domain-containing protein [Limnobaculum parvum]